jgi:hypothetical protein
MIKVHSTLQLHDAGDLLERFKNHTMAERVLGHSLATRLCLYSRDSLGLIKHFETLVETVLLQLNFTALLGERTTTAKYRRSAIAHGAPTNVVA